MSKQVTLYFVGETEDEALDTLPFDSLDSASDYRDDFTEDGRLTIFSATATIDPTTIKAED